MVQLGFVCIWTILYYTKGVHCTVCSEAAASVDTDTEVIRMCQSGSLTTQRVVIDTYDTGHPDVNSCTCTARPYETTSSVLKFGRSYKVEQNLNCGSKFSVVTSVKSSVGFECVWPDVIYSEERNSLDFILSRTKVSNPWQYGYCILLESDRTKWNITCLSPVQFTTKKPFSTTMQPTTMATTTVSTGSGETVSPSSVSLTETSLFMTPDSSTEKRCSQQTVEVVSKAAVIVPIVVVVLIAAVTTIANVILYRRRLELDKESKNTEHVLKPTGSVVYDSIDIDRLEPPQTYADTTAGRMYANTAADTTVS